jgi:hypothetical protein
MLLPAHAGSSLADFPTLKIEALRSFETSVHFTASTQHHIPENGILQSYRCENLKSYKDNNRNNYNKNANNYFLFILIETVVS